MELSIAQIVISTILFIAVPFGLFWFKRYVDARKQLDILLLDLEHAIHDINSSHSRVKIFHNHFKEIRKAATEFEKWIIDPHQKREFKKAVDYFGGGRTSKTEILKLRNTEHAKYIDLFLANHEMACIAPPDTDYEEYINRIARLRRFTGSRTYDF